MFHQNIIFWALYAIMSPPIHMAQILADIWIGTHLFTDLWHFNQVFHKGPISRGLREQLFQTLDLNHISWFYLFELRSCLDMSL